MKRLDNTDSELVLRVLAGETHAFSALLERYTKTLSLIAFPMVRNSEDVRDIVQEAFVIAYCNLDQLTDPARFGGWIRSIAMNRCRKLLDMRSRTERLLERMPIRADAPSPELMWSETARQLLHALNELCEPHRDIAMLYYFQDMKVNDIALLAGRPAGTIKRILSEVRTRLKGELIDMAREELSEYHLTAEQSRRLEMIPVFPRREPKITLVRLPNEAAPLTAVAPYGDFPPLVSGDQGSFADYDYPSRTLSGITHARVEGPVDIGGTPAYRYDHVSFTAEGKLEWLWRPYYSITDNAVLLCAKQFGPAADVNIIAPGQQGWGEPRPRPEPLRIVPGTTAEPVEDQRGYIVDENLWEVRIGRRAFQCVRRSHGGAKLAVEWSDVPISCTATEEFFLADGRMLLWRRYNGMKYSTTNPARMGRAAGAYEMLAEAGTPSMEIFGDRYYLWYDQVPDYALA